MLGRFHAIIDDQIVDHVAAGEPRAGLAVPEALASSADVGAVALLAITEVGPIATSCWTSPWDRYPPRGPPPPAPDLRPAP